MFVFHHALSAIGWFDEEKKTCELLAQVDTLRKNDWIATDGELRLALPRIDKPSIVLPGSRH